MANEIILIIFYVVILLYSVIIHEVMHGVVALWLGDTTAKYAGRITANPFKHIDPQMTIFLPLFMLVLTKGHFAFGGAKPVPYNPYNLKNQKWGPAMVALGGPMSNIIIALIAAILARMIALPVTLKISIIKDFGVLYGSSPNWSSLTYYMHDSLGAIFFVLLIMIIIWNILLAVFNLIPIPPLDGSKILYGIFPIRIETMAIMEQYGFMLLFLVIIADAFTFNILGTILGLMWGIFLNISI
jgi:Zn-dependent protease